MKRRRSEVIFYSRFFCFVWFIIYRFIASYHCRSNNSSQASKQSIHTIKKINHRRIDLDARMHIHIHKMLPIAITSHVARQEVKKRSSQIESYWLSWCIINTCAALLVVVSGC